MKSIQEDHFTLKSHLFYCNWSKLLFYLFCLQKLKSNYVQREITHESSKYDLLHVLIHLVSFRSHKSHFNREKLNSSEKTPPPLFSIGLHAIFHFFNIRHQNKSYMRSSCNCNADNFDCIRMKIFYFRFSGNGALKQTENRQKLTSGTANTPENSIQM